MISKRTVARLIVMFSIIAGVLLVFAEINSPNRHKLSNRIYSVRGQLMWSLAKNEWHHRHPINAIGYGTSAVRFTIKDTINRERAYQHLHKAGKLVQEGQIHEALQTCYTAANLYDTEGATTYRCLEIESQIGKP